MSSKDANPDHAARHWFGRNTHDQGAAGMKVVTEDVNDVFASDLSFGQRLADKVSQFGGSWSFIIIFALVLMFWTLANSFVLHRPFDPYPYIFLNLLLSMLAAVQAPVIMMSQNRQAVKDRIDAANDYKVNLKAEIEIMALHDKLDQMRVDQVEIMFARQQEQIDLLTALLATVRAEGKH